MEFPAGDPHSTSNFGYHVRVPVGNSMEYHVIWVPPAPPFTPYVFVYIYLKPASPAFLQVSSGEPGFHLENLEIMRATRISASDPSFSSAARIKVQTNRANHGVGSDWEGHKLWRLIRGGSDILKLETETFFRGLKLIWMRYRRQD